MNLIVKIVFLLYFLSSSLAFYFWGTSALWIMIIADVMSLFLILKEINFKCAPKRFSYCLLLFVLLVVWSIMTSGLSKGAITFLQYVPFLSLLMLTDEKLKEVYVYVNKYFSLLLLCSFVIYLSVSVFKLNIPNWGIISSGSDVHTLFMNYIFYAEPLYDYELIFPRFNGMFLEPGHLGMICSFMLMANGFSLKTYENKIYLIVLIFTLSLAGYLICFLGYILSVRPKKIIYSLPLFLVLYYIVAVVWDDGDNFINILIFERLAFSEDSIERNARTSDILNNYFEQLNLKQYLMGIGQYNFEKLQKIGYNGAGYKIYILNYGLIGLSLIFLFYYQIVKYAVNKKYVYAFFIVICISFLQRAYPWWLSWFLPFVYLSTIKQTNERGKHIDC